MSLAILSSRALSGLQAWPVQVEVHVGGGLPSFSIVGLPGAGVRESRERVRSAILSSGYEFPSGRITANLAPADLPKDSGRFDLPIALGVLMASGQVCEQQGQVPAVQHYVLAGELSLTGSIMPADSALAIALSVARHGQAPPAGGQSPALLMAPDSAAIAAMVPGLRVLAASSLADVVEHMAGRRELQQAQPVAAFSEQESLPCMADVRGQHLARHALELAAAGGHSLLMCGPPGVGKSMLAQRLPGLLPPLGHLQALEVAAVHGLAQEQFSFSMSPPFRAPHHSASMPALVGGGMRPRPGEISLAHHGVLFLDELPEFERRALEALREPLETAHITISRASGSSRFPASFQLLAAMNPCPCGWHGHPRRECRCPAERIAGYQARISGPLLDRMDLHISLAVEKAWTCLPPGESSAAIRKRVAVARRRQLERQGCLNARLDAAGISRHARPDEQGQRMLADSVSRWAWSARATQRILRVARTLADLDGSHILQEAHLLQAMQFRQGR